MSARRKILAGVGVVGLVVGMLVFGASAASAVTVNPPSFDFGSVTIGQTATLSGQATPDPGYTFIEAEGDGLDSPFQFAFTNCITPHAPCDFSESFAPSVPGFASATLTLVECPDAGNCNGIDVSVSGTGVVGTGTLTAGPGTVAPGGAITVTSVTPCPAPANEVVLEVLSPNGTLVAFNQGALTDSSNDWGGTVSAPSNPGSYLVTAVCSNGGVTVGNYNDVGVTVSSPAPIATTTTLSTSGSPSDYGQPVTLTASVVPAGGGTVSGTVTFSDGSTTLGTVPVTGNQAVLTTSTLAVGSHPITATYNGTDASSSASLTQVVQRAPTELVAATERRANPTTFSATLTSDGTPVPGQTITFTTKKSFGGTTLQCTATTNGAGVATCTGHNAASLSSKRYYTATFAGTGNYYPATATGRLTS